MLPSVYNSITDINYHTDTTLRSMLKEAGYSHFRYNRYDSSGSAINIKKGVKIVWHPCFEHRQSKWYYRLVDVFVRTKRSINETIKVKGSWKTLESCKTEFVRNGSFRCEQLPANNTSAAETLFKNAIAEAAKHTGVEPITKTSLAKGHIQNVIMQDIKAKLEVQLKSMFSDSSYRPDFDANSAVMLKLVPATIGPEAATLTVKMPHTDKLKSAFPEIMITLSDGELTLSPNGFNCYIPQQLTKNLIIPSFVDPSFDIDTLLSCLIAVIHQMRDAADLCYQKQKIINEIEGQIKDECNSFFGIAEDIVLAGFQ